MTDTYDYRVEFWPGFGIPGQLNQETMAIVTVLSVNREIGDCAAYRGITCDEGPEPNPYTIKQIADWGNKIGEAEACKLFPQIVSKMLRYRE